MDRYDLFFWWVCWEDVLQAISIRNFLVNISEVLVTVNLMFGKMMLASSQSR